MDNIGLLGAGGMAREVARYSISNVDFFAVSKEYKPTNSLDTDVRFIDIDNPDAIDRILKVVAAVGAPAVRRAMIDAWPGKVYENIIASSAEVFTEQTSSGLIIAPRAVITDNVRLGNHTIINVSATVSHDSELGEYVTISPGAHIAGNVKLEDGVFVGIGATISNGVHIASGSVVGAGAVVIKDVSEQNSILVGNPARLIKVEEEWLRHV